MKLVSSVQGAIKTARRFVTGADTVRADDIAEPTKLAEAISKGLTRVASIEGRIGPEPVEFEVNCPGAGGTVSLAHGFTGPVRFYVTHWARQLGGITPIRTNPRPITLMQHCYTAAGALTAPAGSQTSGSQWRMRQRKEILGIRFFWRDNGTPTARTVRAKLWNNTSGAVLATKDVAIASGAEVGVFDALFATPITTDLTGVDITTSVWDTGANIHVDLADARWQALMPLFFNEDLKMVHPGVFVAGDARPTTTSATVTFPVEPILGNNIACPELVVDPSNTDPKTLVLKSYSMGKAVIRVEAVQTGVAT